jgi:hypothetical protein
MAKQMLYELKIILEGCQSIIDAHEFKLYYINKYPKYKSLINSYINGYTFHDNIDIISKQDILKQIILCDDKTKAFKILDDCSNDTNDNTIINCIKNIMSNKSYKKRKNKNNNYISKHCPHCNHLVSVPNNTNYVICGYHDHNTGYDHKGCGKDWCFNCGKKLCKNWMEHNLCLESNRIHNDECCKLQAEKMNENYKENYCQCNNNKLKLSDLTFLEI